MHPLEFAVLSVLAEDVRHGYDVIRQVETTAGAVQPADLYRRMRRLRDDGLIDEAPAPKRAKDDDRARRFYRLTPLGWAVARLEASRLQAVLARTRRRTPLFGPATARER
jgi:DNA-binding PadR family transcriptional regulator